MVDTGAAIFVSKGSIDDGKIKYRRLKILHCRFYQGHSFKSMYKL